MFYFNRFDEYCMQVLESENIRFKTGYKLVAGDFPYGKDVRMLPYIPLIERWVPMVEVQWSGDIK